MNVAKGYQKIKRENSMMSQIDTLFCFCKFFRYLTPIFVGFSINLNFLYLIILNFNDIKI